MNVANEFEALEIAKHSSKAAERRRAWELEDLRPRKDRKDYRRHRGVSEAIAKVLQPAPATFDSFPNF